MRGFVHLVAWMQSHAIHLTLQREHPTHRVQLYRVPVRFLGAVRRGRLSRLRSSLYCATMGRQEHCPAWTVLFRNKRKVSILRELNS